MMLQDVVLSQDLFVTDLLDFFFDCLHPGGRNTVDCNSFRSFTLDILLVLHPTARSLEAKYNFAVIGTARIAGLIPRISNDWSGLGTSVIALNCNLFNLCAYQVKHRQALASTVLETLQLPALATAIVSIFDRNQCPQFVLKKCLLSVVGILHWISYYNSKAILDIKFQVGRMFLVAFMLSPSVSIRCRGFLSILNLHHFYRPSNLRLCDPQLEHEDKNIMIPPADLEMRINYLHVGQADPPPAIPLISDSDLCEIALQYVDYELNGPQTNDELYSTPALRSLGTLGAALVDRVDGVLRARGKYYEADVFKMGVTMLVILEMKANDVKQQLIDENYEFARCLAQSGIERWPDRAYFYHAMMKARRDLKNYSDWGTQSVRRAECSPHLAGRIGTDLALTFFSVGVSYVALTHHENHVWRLGVKYLREAEGYAKRTLAILNAESPEAQIMIILLFLVRHLLSTPRAGSTTATDLTGGSIETRN
ncbi:hypothetical protein SISNIDRAFT_353699 [Sistotremastrum niveocremeum HHB9708]|uniref:Uncharacterized protein n=1 Tax=Sistotremastrum niveocremeum HHB9708 TaxID=1314777 RepID=A0A164X679_9AGAM|nr:hypothetical protein SISNIDRAFT_353699 [Sistotremastrum niveocremeum HHB9708]